ncbi:hypothetical protein MIND_01277600 [Mycena indigotica]|uniref:Uncharacterized protein n=1 Tax=Mycena indigotica TaxID=2126181 RepID=A0A8H6VTG0_9AGAR|nr:uncharacterized protein MIND_01277600 [Mycena indigotica]KAF7291331.1 hypothetical protein MIND_01277600 [Mycena indigotica]
MTTTTMPNLVPTLGSSILPATPAHEWAEKMEGELADGAKRADSLAPKDAVDLVPGSFPGGHEESEGVPVVEKAATMLPAEEDVQSTITTVGQRVKEMLPEVLKAYLPSTNMTTAKEMESDAPTFLKETPPADSLLSTSTNLSTQAQAGSIFPPTLESESVPVATPAEADPDPLMTPIAAPVPISGLSAPPVDDTASSNLSTRVHTGTSASPNPVFPSLPADIPHSTPTPPNGSRFLERLESSQSADIDLGLTHTTSPKPLSVAEEEDVHEGARAPNNTMAAPPTEKAILVERGAPDALPTPQAGVLPAELGTDEVSDGPSDDGDEKDGDGEKKERKRDKLVRKLKEKMHVGGAH